MKQIAQTAIVAALLVSASLGMRRLAAEERDATTRPTEDTPRVEVCFVLDTTGSMENLIQGAKDKIWSIANELVAAQPTPDIKFGLVAYRDRGDAYVTQAFDLSEDIDAIYEHLMAFQAKGGGDAPESVNQALHDAVTKMSWSGGRRVLKLVFLVGDAPPHMDYPDDTKYPEVCELAMEKRLIINTIQCGNMPATAKFWTDIARRSEGQYTAILQSGGVVVIATPFDKEIAKLNVQLNATIVGYGDSTVQHAVRSKLAANAAAKAEAVADRADYFRNLRGAGEAFGGKVLGGNDDLVEQLVQQKIKLDEVDSKLLPQDLQKLAPAKRIAAIKERVEQRKRLQRRIDDLLKKRNTFVKNEQAKQAGADYSESFDVTVKRIIKTQGARQGIDFHTSGR